MGRGFVAPPPESWIIFPCFACLKCGKTERLNKTEPRRLISIVLIHSFQSIFSIAPLGPATPALLTRMSRRPNSLSVPSTSAATSAGLETSAGSASTDWPVPASFFSFSAALSSNISPRAQIIRFAPAPRYCLAISNPKPWLAPVTIAQRFSSTLAIVLTDPWKACLPQNTSGVPPREPILAKSDLHPALPDDQSPAAIARQKCFDIPAIQSP